jgi:SSS family solute:Na+ symporter
MTSTTLASFSAQFTWIDWTVVAAYLLITTWIGTALAGRQATIRDFFLGGRKLPWYAVSGSIIATEISAVTFVGVPYVVFAAGGNFTYLQLGLIGTFLARIIVGYVFVPAYYEREIYSPYDYIGNRLGGNTRGVATALFTLGGMLAQSARVYLTALVLSVVLSTQLEWLSASFGASPLAWAIILITIVAVIWTLIGGITTVIWTDVMLFIMFMLGAFIALGTVIVNLDGGFAEILRAGWSVRGEGTGAAQAAPWWDWGKFTFFDFETRYPEIFTKPYTLLAAVVAATWGSLHPYGADQLIVQRMFCCKSEKQARWAIISSTAGQLVTFTVMLVGVGLYAYYTQQPDPTALTTGVERHATFPMLTGESFELFQKEPNRIFPIFIVDVIPVGLKGLLIAAIFAAAISSLTSILAALSQTVMSAFYIPLRQRIVAARGGAPRPPTDTAAAAPPSDISAEDRHSVFMGRLFILIWGVILAAFAYYVKEMSEIFPEILNLALAMAGFAGGALLAGLALGLLPLKIDGWGYQFAAPLSVLYVFAIVFHEPWANMTCWIVGALLLAFWILMHVLRHPAAPPRVPLLVQLTLYLAGIAGMVLISYFGRFTVVQPNGDATQQILAWPWYVPVGSSVGFILGWLLARRREREPTTA